MMGLLDSNDLTDDPRTQGLLSLGLRLLSSQGKFGPALGQAGLGAMGDLQAAAQQRDARKRAGLQDQMLMMQMEQQKRQQAAQEAAAARKTRDDELLAGAFRPMPGPMPDGSAGVTPRFDVRSLLGGGLSMDSVPQAINLQQALNPPRKLRDVAAGGAVIDEADPTKALFTAPKEDTPDPVSKLMAARDKFPPGSPQWATLNDAIKKATTHAPATSVNVNTGQKGYENESKLRNDFKSEPIYKDYNDMLQAHKQIKAGIAQGTPIGDVATATKVMKLLDPGSVVRESELGIAMAAGGKMDRLQNYVQMQLSGEKLTPTMRKDFGNLADELVAAAGQAYNKKRSEYEGMANRYGLDPTVLGAPYSQPASEPGAGQTYVRDASGRLVLKGK